MKILIITPGHPGPDIKSLPPALTAPYLAGLISNITTEIEIVDLAVQNFLIENYSPSSEVIAWMCHSCIAAEY